MKIVVSPNPYRDKQFKHARQACQILKEAGAEVSLCLPFDVDRSFEIPSDLRFREIQKEIRTADMLICFGGDGTILHSSKIATEHGLPILGVNIGTMGFIAELEASEMELLRKIPQGDYTVEPRTMLDVSVVSGKQTLFHETALNDAVITKGAIARVVQLSITCDGVEATSFSGDGVILCTPTGSTAYSMSAGGPIVEPSAKNFLITPICAHAMLAKSIVVAPDRVIAVRVGKVGRHNAFLSVDGGRAFRLNVGDEIVVKSSQKVTRLVRLKDISFFEILNKKFIEKMRSAPMQSKRQEKILELIHDHSVQTQEQLLAELNDAGFRTTQATISRDIKQLRIIKELGPDGVYRYSTTPKPVEHTFSAKLNLIFRQCITSVDYAQNMIVIKTMPGLANGAAAAIDKLNIPEMLGTLAGDDTCFVVLKDTQSAASLCAEIREQIVH